MGKKSKRQGRKSHREVDVFVSVLVENAWKKEQEHIRKGNGRVQIQILRVEEEQ